MLRESFVVGLALALTASACLALPDRDDHANAPPPLGRVGEPLALSAVSTLKQIYVENAGALDIEGNYLPQVVCCENGGAHPEALKAQAVMARSYMYYSYYGDKTGTAAHPLTGTTADQAYFCSNEVNQACKDAVAATSDQIMAYEKAGELFANVGFFVDGPKPACLKSGTCTCTKPTVATAMTPDDHPADCDCFTFSSQGAANPAYVTYNWSKTGADVAGSTIGNTSDESNRGCASQNIQNCLGRAGFSYVDQLRMFYGQDLELRHSDGTPIAVDAGSVPPGQGPGGDDAGAGPSSNGDSGPPASGDRLDSSSTSSGCQIASPRGSTSTFASPVAAILVGLLCRRHTRRGRRATIET